MVVVFLKQSTSFYVSHFVNEETKNCRSNGTPTIGSSSKFGLISIGFEICILLNPTCPPMTRNVANILSLGFYKSTRSVSLTTSIIVIVAFLNSDTRIPKWPLISPVYSHRFSQPWHNYISSYIVSLGGRRVGHLVHCRMFSSICDFYSLDARSTPYAKSWHSKMSQTLSLFPGHWQLRITGVRNSTSTWHLRQGSGFSFY